MFLNNRKSPVQAGREAEKGEAWRRSKVERKTVTETRERESERERETQYLRGEILVCIPCLLMSFAPSDSAGSTYILTLQQIIITEVSL